MSFLVIRCSILLTGKASLVMLSWVGWENRATVSTFVADVIRMSEKQRAAEESIVLFKG